MKKNIVFIGIFSVLLCCISCSYNIKYLKKEYLGLMNYQVKLGKKYQVYQNVIIV